MSHTPNLPDAGHEHLRRAIDQLPAHAPDEALWQRLETHLAAAAAVARALPHLPTHAPDDALWGAIAAELDAPAPLTLMPAVEPVAPETAAPVRRLWPAWRYVAGVAAAVLLALLVGRLRPAETPTVAATAPPAPRETISYSEEELPAPAAPAASGIATPDPLDSQGRAFIDAHCSSLPTVCQSAEFQELRAQLTELEAEEQRLQRDARRLGDSPEMVRQQVSVTTQKAAVTRELIQLIIS